MRLGAASFTRIPANRRIAELSYPVCQEVQKMRRRKILALAMLALVASVSALGYEPGGSVLFALGGSFI